MKLKSLICGTGYTVLRKSNAILNRGDISVVIFSRFSSTFPIININQIMQDI